MPDDDPATSATLPQAYGITTRNLVGSAHLGRAFNLRVLAEALGGSYHPQRFRAAFFRVRLPTATVILFANGMVLCVGTHHRTDALGALYLFQWRLLRTLRLVTSFHGFRVHNVVSSVSLGHYLDLPAMQRHHPVRCIYNPDVFEGLKLIVNWDPYGDGHSTTLVLFRTGRVLVAGGRSRTDHVWLLAQILPMLRAYRRDEPPPNPSRARRRRGRARLLPLPGEAGTATAADEVLDSLDADTLGVVQETAARAGAVPKSTSQDRAAVDVVVHPETGEPCYRGAPHPRLPHRWLFPREGRAVLTSAPDADTDASRWQWYRAPPGPGGCKHVRRLWHVPTRQARAPRCVDCHAPAAPHVFEAQTNACEHDTGWCRLRALQPECDRCGWVDHDDRYYSAYLRRKRRQAARRRDRQDRRARKRTAAGAGPGGPGEGRHVRARRFKQVVLPNGETRVLPPPRLMSEAEHRRACAALTRQVTSDTTGVLPVPPDGDDGSRRTLTAVVQAPYELPPGWEVPVGWELYPEHTTTPGMPLWRYMASAPRTDP